jgi:hypothetical protein
MRLESLLQTASAAFEVGSGTSVKEPKRARFVENPVLPLAGIRK